MVRKQRPLPMVQQPRVQQPRVQPLQPPPRPFPWVGLKLWTPLTTIPTGQSLTPPNNAYFIVDVVDVTSMSVHYRL